MVVIWVSWLDQTAEFSILPLGSSTNRLWGSIKATPEHPQRFFLVSKIRLLFALVPEVELAKTQDHWRT